MDALPQWHVIPTRVIQDTRLRDDGMGIEPYHKVTYQIDSGPAKGKTRTVEIADANLTAEEVRQAIVDDLTNHTGVISLKS